MNPIANDIIQVAAIANHNTFDFEITVGLKYFKIRQTDLFESKSRVSCEEIVFHYLFVQQLIWN